MRCSITGASRVGLICRVRVFNSGKKLSFAEIHPNTAMQTGDIMNQHITRQTRRGPTSLHTLITTALSGVFLVAGCASPGAGPAETTYPSTSQRGYGSSYGVVESINVIDSQGASNNIGIGTVGGAVVGAVLGNQVGSGSGRKAATIAGAVGGGVIGNRVDQNRGANKPTMYDVRVRLDDGSYRTIRQDMLDDIRVGNRVRIENGRLYRY